MPATVKPAELAELQGNAEQVRNICILAHVDHGKTTLSDCLVSSNGIISERLAGSVRYLDSRADEQERGITMQSSAISLLYKHERLNKEYLVNLIDSPGHVDFSSDVSTAVRLCDGALVVVDVIEGVAIQTHAVLRQAWEERLRPCLVLNKIDRLIIERQLDPIEAYEHLLKIVERVNAILLGFMNASVMAAGSSERNPTADVDEELGDDKIDTQAWALEFDDDEENAYIFAPEKGNVVFCSAADSWAFRTLDFVPMVAQALGIKNRRKVLRSLWGNFWYSAKQGKIMQSKSTQASVTTGEASRQHPPMFASYVLDAIWQIYGATVIDSKPKKLEKIVTRLGISEKVNRRELNKGGRAALRTAMHAWLPVTRAVLSMVVRCVPDPVRAQNRRAEVLWPHVHAEEPLESRLAEARAHIERCDPQGPLIAYVTKIFAVQRSEVTPQTAALLEDLRRKQQAAAGETSSGQDLVSSEAGAALGTANGEEHDDSSSELFFAFARVFSGTVRPGVPVHVLGPKYLPTHPDRHRAQVPCGVIPLLMMNTELVPLGAAPAGNILALAGLDRDVLKSATISDSPQCCSLTKMPSQSAPVLRVSLEPSNPLEWPQLTRGLKLLNRADAVAEVRIQPNGEHILGCIGELHLERCVKDLQERFAKIELKVSKPIAIFRETVVVAGSHVPTPQPSFAPFDVRKEETKFAEAMQQYTAAVSGGNGGGTADADARDGENGEVDVDQIAVKLTPPEPFARRVLPGGRVLACTGGNAVVVCLRVIPLPEPIRKVIEESRADLTDLLEEDDADADDQDAALDATGAGAEMGDATNRGSRVHSSTSRASARRSSRAQQLRRSSSSRTQGENVAEAERARREEARRADIFAKLQEAFGEAGEDWDLQRLWSLGPRGVGPNVLLNAVDAGQPLASHRMYQLLSKASSAVIAEEGNAEGHNAEDEEDEDESPEATSQLLEEVAGGIIAGFQLGCRAGPLCEEPLWGTCVVVEQVTLKDASAEEHAALKRNVAIQGQVMSSVRDAIRRGVSLHHDQHLHGVDTGCEVRLVEGFFKCMLQCHVESQMGDQLGRMYGVLSGRRAKIMSEDMWEGTSIFTIEALVPIVESFRLGDDLRRQTSGAASTPQLLFSHWQVIPENPFFRATTEDELEEFGERGYEESYQAHNRAYKYMQEIRKRKGLSTSEKVVVAAEKQRTLARKK
ncbi:Elongation factor-like GTPase 1 [Hondaea fermentalgiana]|uniref:Elongation factor-like GTPase 1 n=1 Tax=Hondaea fermentalgiana TaxID=2315210 RepID=A0A2R5GPG6_9STRA|nr:Elongation factor-like GTPase 1 [Hondaea fermentalgiana]|eukprot:GBG30221.1 Elongation factor-like GTPase 1 [Hondaea fermentalgiana]